jgi:hypothetical protein
MAVSTFLGRTSWNGLLLSVAASALGLLLTHLFRRVIHRGGWKELPPTRLAPRVFAACAGLGLVTGFLTFPILLPMLPAEARTAEVMSSNVVSTGFLYVGWFLLYFSYHYFQRGRDAQEAEWRLRVAMRENELRTLRAQLNPHFLFNSLNSLRGLITESPELELEAAQVINLKAVDSIHPWFGGRLMARIDGGAEVVLSPRKSKEFRELMSV